MPVNEDNAQTILYEPITEILPDIKTMVDTETDKFIMGRRSTDEGCAWTRPLSPSTGLLVPGGPRRQPPDYHCTPVDTVDVMILQDSVQLARR